MNTTASLQKQHPVEYEAWRSMKKNAKKLGLRVAKAWQDFEGFFAAVGSRPSPNHKFTRKNKNVGFNPHNAGWTISENIKTVKVKGETVVVNPRKKRQSKKNDKVTHTGDGPGRPTIEMGDNYFVGNDPDRPRIRHTHPISHTVRPDDIGLGNPPKPAISCDCGQVTGESNLWVLCSNCRTPARPAGTPTPVGVALRKPEHSWNPSVRICDLTGNRFSVSYSKDGKAVRITLANTKVTILEDGAISIAPVKSVPKLPLPPNAFP